MPTINSVLIFLCFSLGLRWFIFKYKLFYSLREYLNDKHPLFTELFACPYCQTFEASVLVYFLLGMPFDLVAGFLCSLFNAYVAIALENTIEGQIDELEGVFEITLDSELDKN